MKTKETILKLTKFNLITTMKKKLKQVLHYNNRMDLLIYSSIVLIVYTLIILIVN